MGYFSQKKQKLREKNLTSFSAIGLGVVCVLIMTNQSFIPILDSWLLAIFIFNIFLLALCIYRKHTFFSILFALYFIIFYTNITSHANLITSYKVASPKNISLVYQPSGKINLLSKNDITRFGNIKFADNNSASFFEANSYGENIVFVAVDFSKLSKDEIYKNLDALEKLILQENSSIVVLGNFGIPAWNSQFEKFLDTTSLKVKNRIYSRNNKLSPRLFTTPQFNILGFDNIGIHDVKFKDRKAYITLDIY